MTLFLPKRALLMHGTARAAPLNRVAACTTRASSERALSTTQSRTKSQSPSAPSKQPASEKAWIERLKQEHGEDGWEAVYNESKARAARNAEAVREKHRQEKAQRKAEVEAKLKEAEMLQQLKKAKRKAQREVEAELGKKAPTSWGPASSKSKDDFFSRFKDDYMKPGSSRGRGGSSGGLMEDENEHETDPGYDRYGTQQRSVTPIPRDLFDNGFRPPPETADRLERRAAHVVAEERPPFEWDRERPDYNQMRYGSRSNALGRSEQRGHGKGGNERQSSDWGRKDTSDWGNRQSFDRKTTDHFEQRGHDRYESRQQSSNWGRNDFNEGGHRQSYEPRRSNRFEQDRTDAFQEGGDWRKPRSEHSTFATRNSYSARTRTSSSSGTRSEYWAALFDHNDEGTVADGGAASGRNHSARGSDMREPRPTNNDSRRDLYQKARAGEFDAKRRPRNREERPSQRNGGDPWSTIANQAFAESPQPTRKNVLF